MKKYSKDHEWVELHDGIATVGITNYAQDQLGDIVFVQMPEIGRSVSSGDSIAEIESTKSVSDIYAPVDGAVSEVNNTVVDDPSVINSDPENSGWLFKLSGVKDESLADLMDEAAYQALCK